MTPERFHFLQSDFDAKLTQEELDEGYFFCCTWDYLLIHKTDREADCCSCIDRTAGDGIPTSTTTTKEP